MCISGQRPKGIAYHNWPRPVFFTWGLGPRELGLWGPRGAGTQAAGALGGWDGRSLARSLVRSLLRLFARSDGGRKFSPVFYRTSFPEALRPWGTVQYSKVHYSSWAGDTICNFWTLFNNRIYIADIFPLFDISLLLFENFVSLLVYSHTETNIFLPLSLPPLRLHSKWHRCVWKWISHKTSI